VLGSAFEEHGQREHLSLFYLGSYQWLLVRGHFLRPLIRVYLCLFLPTGATFYIIGISFPGYLKLAL
jgi:hypothetical protein